MSAKELLDWIGVETKLPPLTVPDTQDVQVGQRLLPTYTWSEDVPVLLSNGRKTMDRLVKQDNSTYPPFWYLNEGRVTHWFELPPAPLEKTT